MALKGPSPDLWQQIIEHVIAHGGQLIQPWFDKLEMVTLEHGLLEIRAPGPQEQAYCQEHARALFTEAAQAATGMLVTVCFLAQPPSAGTPDAIQGEPGLGLMPDYTFANFVTGPCNRLAAAACLAVAESPGRAYNPLFIHGSAGLGKTHLLQAICHAIRATGRGAVVYLSCESFINRLIDAIQLGKVQEFRYRYRKADVLVIDDVQFLSRHEQTQEEFFHTFNTLYQAQKQIVLSCDRPPSHIAQLEERLVSRFNWGLVVSIGPPAYETRVAIVRKKATARGINLPEQVVCLIAASIDSNTRELEGAITKVAMLARVSGREIDVALAEEALGLDGPSRQREVSIEQIIEAVTKRFGVRLADLQSRKRTRSVTLPRQVCMHLARRLTRHSLKEIGGYFGGRDHSTVLHADRTIRRRRKSDLELDGTIDRLTQELRAARS